MTGRKTRRLRLGIDVSLACALVAVMACALVEEAPHEWLGILLIALACCHVALSWKWIAAVCRTLARRRDPLRIAQLAVMAALAACLLGLAASALVISRHALAALPALPGAGSARGVHMLCSHWAFTLAFVHAGLQLAGVRLHARIPGGAWRALLIAALAAACVFGAMSLVRLRLPEYLLGQVAFAAPDSATPLSLRICRWAGAGALITAVSYAASMALDKGAGARHGRRAQIER